MRAMFSGNTNAVPGLDAERAGQTRARFFDANGVQLHYVTAGTGEPVVLLHGITRSIDTDWRDPGLFDALAAGFQVTALDQRGHGRSDKPRGRSAYGMEMVYDVIRLLDHLRVEAAHVVGYSMGGRIALKLAAIAPARLHSAVLVGSGGVRTPFDTLLWHTLAASLECGDGIQPLIRAIWPVSAPPPTTGQLEEISRRSMTGNDPVAIAAVAREFGAWMVGEAILRSNRVPALAVVGSQDPNQPAVAGLAEVMERLEVAVIPGRDHVDTLGDAAFIRTVNDFLKKQ